MMPPTSLGSSPAGPAVHLAPHSRLVAWTALAGLPLLTVATALPAARGWSLGLFSLLALVAIADAVLSRASLAGVEVRLPATVRLSLQRPGTLATWVESASGPLTLRLALALPREIDCEPLDLVTELPQAGVWGLEWRLESRRRGRFPLSECRLETRSRAGLWAVRRNVELATELRVYPDLLRERRHAPSLFLRRGRLGHKPRRQVGKGRELEQLREYLPGDSYEDIHWKATARRTWPVTKVFQIERTQEVYVVVDSSRLMSRPAGEPPEPALERAINAALLLALAAERQGDLFGLVVFSHRIRRFVRAAGGKAHFQACREALVDLEPEETTPDFGEVAAFLRARLRKRALLVFLTDLEDPVLAEDFVRGVELLARHHLLEVVMLRPPLAGDLFAEEGVASEVEIYRRLAGQLRWHDLEQLRRTLQRRGAHLSLVESEHLSPEVVSRYTEVKQRQLL